MSLNKNITRRRVLRGAFKGAALGVSLPFLECFLNLNGTALANGAPMPVRFISWFWGLGFTPGRWEPEKVGPLVDQPLGPELAALEPHKDKINIFSKFNVHLNGRANFPHESGWVGQLTGVAPIDKDASFSEPTLDTFIADAVGQSTRFRELIVTCSGNPRDTLSFRAGGVRQPADFSPAELYTRIFGPEFKDPNSGSFTPDPAVMLKKSVLSFVKEDRDSLMKQVSSTDRARLDEYFTSLRQLEQQVAIQLQEPAPLEACYIPEKPDVDYELGTEIETALRTNRLMAQLIAHAMLCDQTRVASILFSTPGSNLRVPGDTRTHHTYSHEESIDRELGYQKMVSYFNRRSMEGFAALIETLQSFQEGDGTLLDHALVLATTDVGNANTHATENVPTLTAGRAGGAMETGLHVQKLGDPATRVGLTAMQAMKVPVASFGALSNQVDSGVTDVLA